MMCPRAARAGPNTSTRGDVPKPPSNCASQAAGEPRGRVGARPAAPGGAERDAARAAAADVAVDAHERVASLHGRDAGRVVGELEHHAVAALGHGGEGVARAPVAEAAAERGARSLELDAEPERAAGQVERAAPGAGQRRRDREQQGGDHVPAPPAAWAHSARPRHLDVERVARPRRGTREDAAVGAERVAGAIEVEQERAVRLRQEFHETAAVVRPAGAGAVAEEDLQLRLVLRGARQPPHREPERLAAPRGRHRAASAARSSVPSGPSSATLRAAGGGTSETRSAASAL